MDLTKRIVIYGTVTLDNIVLNIHEHYLVELLDDYGIYETILLVDNSKLPVIQRGDEIVLGDTLKV